MAIVIGAEFQMFAFWKEARDPSYPSHHSSAVKRCSSHVIKFEPQDDKRYTVFVVFLCKLLKSNRGCLLKLKFCIVIVCFYIFFITCSGWKWLLREKCLPKPALCILWIKTSSSLKKVNRTKNLKYVVLVVKFRIFDCLKMLQHWHKCTTEISHGLGYFSIFICFGVFFLKG